ncbi:MAG: methylmalonyl-CoA epimerase [Candidatus Neomarinimicrobiota bacterium]
MKILGIEHVAVAVEDREEPAMVFQRLLGLQDRRTETVADQQVITDIFNTGRGKVELLEATTPDSPVARFIAKRGPGIHHIAFLVDDLPAWLRHLKQQGVELLDSEPRRGAEGYQIAFLHPRSTAGILVELCQKS